MLKQLISGDRIRPEIFEQYPDSFANAFASWNEKVPFVGLLSDSNFIIKFLCGQISERTVISKIEENLADTEVTIGWTIDNVAAGRKIPLWIRDVGMGLRDRYVALIDKFENSRPKNISLEESQKLLNLAFDEINLRTDLRKRLIDLVFTPSRRKACRTEISQRDWERVHDTVFGSLPSLDAMVSAFEEYIRFSFRQTKYPRKMLASDYGDLLHMSLLPYADIFRADAFAAEVARKVANDSQTRVVARLSELQI